MKGIDLSKALKPYSDGWVAINKENKVVAHAKTFELIAKKVEGVKDIFLMPVAKNYFGFVTFLNV